MPELVKPSLPIVTFHCPYCGHPHSFQATGQSYPILLDCPGDECFYSFVIHPRGEFPDLPAAERHSRNRLPTVGPRHTFLHQSHWILAHQYRELDPHSVVNLTQFVNEDAVRALLQGFSQTLSSNVTVLESRGGEFHRIDPGDPDQYACDFCGIVHASADGTRRCHDSIRAIVANRWGDKKPYSDVCWIGLEKYFVPILVEGRVVAVFVCGNMQTARLREKQERQIRKGIKDALKLGLDTGILEEAAGIAPKEEQTRFGLKNLFKRPNIKDSRSRTPSPLEWRTEHDHRTRTKAVESRARILEELAEKGYHAQRRLIDGRFINEIGALFNTPEYLDGVALYQKDPRRDALWKMLSHVLHRSAHFLDIEEAHYFVAEAQNVEEGSQHVFVPKASSTRLVPSGTLDGELLKPILTAKENCFWPPDEPEPGADSVRRLVDALKVWWKRVPRNVVFCPVVPREDGESCLVLINRKGQDHRFSSAFRRCVRNVAREVSHNVNHALRTIRLEAEQERLRDYIENTFHTLNQSMYDIGMAMQMLDLRTARDGFSEKPVFKALHRMRSAVTELDARKDLLYSYVSYLQAEYRFDIQFSLPELIQECADKFRAAAKSREILIETSVDVQEEGVYWDRFHIDVLMTNLIHNAMKYSHRHKNVIVNVRESILQKSIEITVSNYGHGIPSEETQKIFERGFRSSIKDSRRPIRGTGLGLFMVSEVVRHHHGEIHVSSVREGRQHSIKEGINWEGFNTTFTVTIPRRVR